MSSPLIGSAELMEPDELDALEYEDRFEHKTGRESDYRPMGFWNKYRSQRMHKGKMQSGGAKQGFIEPNLALEGEE